ncbi:hypothetical protein K505DRAFT_328514 [Melanomma pulvis-pyrius CBS 109.77]|uniref:Uncharacterized protein n=1 Tax=Melanomma pulvis-pyrius CBS 109.77 TaxID=1314802 RepID=A0A6A6WY86_9PLEO|nr:hypothetical protein K505DRAFT_328514 [Melanomma pulvis-pyrius CBS 109.77]
MFFWKRESTQRIPTTTPHPDSTLYSECPAITDSITHLHHAPTNPQASTGQVHTYNHHPTKDSKTHDKSPSQDT